MKKILILLCVLLPLFGGVCWAQVDKEKMTESDGFVWYKVTNKTTFQEGAESATGKTLVPTGDYMIIYQTTSGGWFELLTEKAEGAYSKDGKCVVPISRGYDEVSYKANQGFSLVKRNGKVGVCDNTGAEIVPCNYKNISYSSNGFKYEDAAGRWIALGVNHRGSTPSNTKFSKTQYTDLSVFELKGRVKSCTYSGHHTPFCIDGADLNHSFEFSPDGKLVMKDPSKKFKRDKMGRLEKIDDYTIDYDEKGRVKSTLCTYFLFFALCSDRCHYTYDEKGRVSQIDIEDVTASGTNLAEIIADAIVNTMENDKEYHTYMYTYTKFDSKGNWIERTVIDNLGEVMGETEYRTITYY